ncbi:MULTISPECIES: MarR family winged helix-turn-helix transcriptional regulator [Arthrobacter]|uniref:Winged helix-turn-helix transcriptional regulator n=1 Tax=Arthrobacter wenxiniae TaxID=2713570 RepID=A0A7Y7IJU8_9MICC|nr:MULTISPECIES: MarR family winged helix-turn-helix transcriptional regulator [Arthrobacter]MCU6479546.1 MarR family winged helix-turn-helix transcriptional regulator [Arthrobacter sp. A2-55]NVM96755.1 winged helix-turn-helix transcriptional regulator [Arthrobacter wenxiniae]
MTHTAEALPEPPSEPLHGVGDAWSLTDVITRLRRVLRSSVRHEFPWEALPMAQVEILQRLADEPDLGVSELAARQRLATNTVSNLIQQMVVSQLVSRTPRPGDRRAQNLRLTRTGTELLQAWQNANERRVADALSRLPRHRQTLIEEAIPALSELAALLETDESTDTTIGRAAEKP